MSYADDFYTKENIIGYTGDINNKPTVYFERKNGDGTISYGHITQYYPADPDNVGRDFVNTVKESEYTRKNELVLIDQEENGMLPEEFMTKNEDKFDITAISERKDKNGKVWKVGERSVERGKEVHHISRTPFISKKGCSLFDIKKLEASLSVQHIKEKDRHKTPEGAAELDKFMDDFVKLSAENTNDKNVMATPKNKKLESEEELLLQFESLYIMGVGKGKGESNAKNVLEGFMLPDHTATKAVTSGTPRNTQRRKTEQKPTNLGNTNTRKSRRKSRGPGQG